MITEDEAKDLIVDYHKLLGLSKTDKKYADQLKKHEDLCINKFDYLIKMKTAKYKKFNNYEDLYQEGRLALFRAMSNYDSSKGSFFWWAHHYVGTKVKRSANLHTAVRYPLKQANKYTPHRVELNTANIFSSFTEGGNMLSIQLIDDYNRPDKIAERSETYELIRDSLQLLSSNQREIISLAYGIDVDAPYPISKICSTLNITRVQCLSILKSAKSKIKNNILNKKD